MNFKKITLGVALTAALFSMGANAATFMSDYKGSFNIKETPADSAIAKDFLKTGKNGYTAQATADKAKAKEFRKIYLKYSCSACHGGNAGGLSGPDLSDDRWNNNKAGLTDKGAFEVIAAGTNNGMSPRHSQVAGNPDLLTTDEILKIVGYLRSEYRGPKENAANWNK